MCVCVCVGGGSVFLKTMFVGASPCGSVCVLVFTNTGESQQSGIVWSSLDSTGVKLILVLATQEKLHLRKVQAVL